MSDISVITLARGRDDHLANLVRGLAQSGMRPHELVIAAMQDQAFVVPDAPFPVRQILLGGDALGLAHARNAGAIEARAERLVFLDVDCIPSPDLVADYAAAMDLADGLLMGEVLYLPKGATERGIDFARFARAGVKHSERAGPPDGPIGACSDYRCFWSLNFAIRRNLFLALGGFDEDYSGYGGEDTDFGRVAAEAGVDLLWVRGARAYHQYHAHHMPPVHHLRSVLANAARFRDKWGHYTMEHWLRAFEAMGLIERQGDGYGIVREPTEADLALTRQQAHQPYASTAAFLASFDAAQASAAPERVAA